jgi:putative dimethyl sulfoxide reductase chaperone
METEIQDTKQDLIEFFDANAETFTFLSQVFFKELTADAIDELAAGQWPETTGNAKLDRGYNLLRRYFKFSAGDRRSQLAVEYARIFLAAGVHSADTASAVPYESVFTGEEHSVMGESRDQVVRWFVEDGYQVNPDLHEPEDHIAFEFEYLASMNAKASALVAAGDNMLARKNAKRQVRFIDDHLLNWIGLLSQAAAASAKTTFYTGMLLVAEGALEQARAALVDAADELPLMAA